jgi:hypothetical protein
LDITEGPSDADSLWVTIDIAYSRIVNYAAQQNSVPVIHSLKISNLLAVPITNLKVSLTVDPVFAAPLEIRAAMVDAGETYNFGCVDLAVSHDFLRNLTEQVLGTISIELSADHGLSSRRVEKIAVLAYDEWSALSGVPELLSAFVLPNHPAVEGILSRAADILGTNTGDPSINGYQSKSRARALQQTFAIFAALQECHLRYVNPPSSFEVGTGQKIRTPDRILESRLCTCLDIAAFAAACLEQAGLYPLICLFSGHAYAGVWLEQETFADCATDDLLRLKKRIELGEISVFETVILTQASGTFDNAIEAANKRLEVSSDFRYVLDIHRCRMNSLKPLPFRGAARRDADAVIALEAFPDSFTDIDAVSPAAHASETPASRLDGWKRKLLDLTMNNRLLNFRGTKKTLPLLAHDLQTLKVAIAEGNTFAILPYPSNFGEDGQRDHEIHRLTAGAGALSELVKGELTANRLHSSLTEAEIGHRLPEIYREARLSIEESGANTLYLALGFLSWYESGTSEKEHLAPIILVPVEIDRRSVQEGFTIKQGDEAPMVNATLLELLKHDFDISVPGVESLFNSERSFDVKSILNAFRRAVKLIDRWEVQEAAALGHFSFTKFMMWRDLELRTDELTKNKIVNHLINTPNYPFDNDGSGFKPEALDQLFKPSDVFCTMDADSSQLAAVCSAAAGKSFVLHGPPGTGKSQTITNIISNTLAGGKSFIFPLQSNEYAQISTSF